jgi:hypothetical protein
MGILSVVVWQRVNTTPHREAYDPAVEHAAVWYGQHAEMETPAVPKSPPPMWTPLGSALESLDGMAELDLKDGEKAEEKVEPEIAVVEEVKVRGS